jgi:hypothetical protein
MLAVKDDVNEFLNGLYNFLNFDRVIMDNLITTIIYIVYIYICVKNGANWITVLIGYLIISTIFEFLGISGFLNIITILETLFSSIIDIIFAPAKGFLDTLKDIIDAITPW